MPRQPRSRIDYPFLRDLTLVTVQAIRGFRAELILANPAVNAPKIKEVTGAHHGANLSKGDVQLRADTESENIRVGKLVNQLPGINRTDASSRWNRGLYYAQLYELMKRQPRGEPGALLTQARLGNAMVLRDAPEWTIVAYWYNHEEARSDPAYDTPDYGQDGWIQYLVPSTDERACKPGMHILFPF